MEGKFKCHDSNISARSYQAVGIGHIIDMLSGTECEIWHVKVQTTFTVESLTSFVWGGAWYTRYRH